MVYLSQEKPLQGPITQVNYEYECHKPEATLLYQIIQEHWPGFQAELERQGK